MSEPLTSSAPGGARVLLVDDEPQVLVGLGRQIRSLCAVETAPGGKEALALLESTGPFAVVISDMRMPLMTGAQLLEKVAARWPDTVRVMLTGNADQDTAVQAVNRAQVFRFLNKPCSKETLTSVVELALRQHRLQAVERELLENTLRGSVRILTETLELVNPMAFSRSGRLKRYVLHMAGELGLQDTWTFEVAAMLSQIGCVTLDEKTLTRVFKGEPLEAREAEAHAAHPLIAVRLLQNVSRLQPVARMIAALAGPAATAIPAAPPAPDEATEALVETGAALLRAASAFDDAIVRGLALNDAIREARARCRPTDGPCLETLRSLPHEESGLEVRSCFLSELRPGMVLDQDVNMRNGMLLLARGQELTFSALQRLRNTIGAEGATVPFRVQIPPDKDDPLFGARAA